MKPNSVNSSELIEEYGFSENDMLEPTISAVNFIDTNSDGNIDQYDLFETFGTLVTCNEFSNRYLMRSFNGPSNSDRFKGECYYDKLPITSDFFMYSPYVSKDALDTKLHIDLVMSIGKYLIENSDIVSDSEMKMLSASCNPIIDRHTVLKSTSTSMPVEEKASNVLILGDGTILDSKTKFVLINTESSDLANQYTINNVQMDPDVVDAFNANKDSILTYLKNVCSEAKELTAEDLTSREENLDKAIYEIMDMDSDDAINPVDALHTENTESIVVQCPQSDK